MSLFFIALPVRAAQISPLLSRSRVNFDFEICQRCKAGALLSAVWFATAKCIESVAVAPDPDDHRGKAQMVVRGRNTKWGRVERSQAMESESEFKWPHRGDRLLRAEKDWHRAVTFSEHEIARHAHIWSGYMQAGALLVEQCQSTEWTLRHGLIYPIFFCYRHGLELAIKWIIQRYGRYADVPDEDYTHHDLWQLWKVCKKIIIDVGSDGDMESLMAVEQVVKDFHDLDKGSFSFRYSTDKKGALIRLPDVAFDLTNIKDVMEAVDNLFSGADGQLDADSSAAGWY